MEDFFAKYLGGRSQKEVPADVAAKLKEITVDPKTVSGDVSLKGSVGTVMLSGSSTPVRRGKQPRGNLHGRPCMPSDIFGSGSRVESAALHSACVCETNSRALMEYAGRCLICFKDCLGPSSLSG